MQIAFLAVSKTENLLERRKMQGFGNGVGSVRFIGIPGATGLHPDLPQESTG